MSWINGAVTAGGDLSFVLRGVYETCSIFCVSFRLRNHQFRGGRYVADWKAVTISRESASC